MKPDLFSVLESVRNNSSTLSSVLSSGSLLSQVKALISIVLDNKYLIKQVGVMSITCYVYVVIFLVLHSFCQLGKETPDVYLFMSIVLAFIVSYSLFLHINLSILNLFFTLLNTIPRPHL